MILAQVALGVLPGAAVTMVNAEEIAVFAAGDRIAGDERADGLASANMEHPKALEAHAWTPRIERFARNRMCLLARGVLP